MNFNESNNITKCKNMKKFLFAILACTIALGFTSCREKKAKDKVKDRVENVKESVEDALEEAQEQIEEGADDVRKALDEAGDKIEKAKEKLE